MLFGMTYAHTLNFVQKTKGIMMATLVEYLNALDSDAALKAAHEADPQATMKNYGLTDEEIQSVLSGDEAAVTKKAGVDETSASAIQILHIESTDK